MTLALSNPAFLSGSAVQFALDSTSLGALKTCPQFYKLSIIDGWQPKAPRVDLKFGILIHAARERFYHAKAAGQEHDEAVLFALRWLLEETFDRELGKPWTTDNSNKNRLTLIRTLVWYCDDWKEDPLETIMLASGKPAVELSFRFDSGYKTRDGEPFLLCGHMDRLARFAGQTYVSDLKSTKQTLDQGYFSQFTPDNQLSLYAFASKIVWGEDVAGVIIDAAQIAVTFSRFQRGIVSRTQDQLAEWYEELGDWIGLLQLYADRGRWPHNDRSCFRCDFRKICSKPPSVREQWLKADFVKRIWNPLAARGDI